MIIHQEAVHFVKGMVSLLTISQW